MEERKWIIYRVNGNGRLVKIGFVESAKSNPDALLQAFKLFPTVVDRTKRGNGLVARPYKG